MRWTSLLSLALLAGCGGEGAEQRTAVQATREGASVETLPDRGTQQAVTVDHGAVAVPATAAFDFTGDWAASPGLCREGRWRFRTDGVETAGETNCTGRPADPSTLPIRIDYACTAEGARSPERWTLEPLPDGRMRVLRTAGATRIAEVTLQRCGAAG